MRLPVLLRPVLVSMLTGLLLACSGGGSSDVRQGSSASIIRFQAVPGIIDPGQSAALTGVFTGGTGRITPGDLAADSGTAVQVSPLATTAYTLVVTDPQNRGVTRTLTVTVLAPAITSFSADNTTITAGDTVQLTAVFSNGTGLITPGNIAVTSGTPVPVTPAVSTVYTLTVSGLAGTSATATVSITVN